MVQKNNFMKRAGARGDSPLARVLTAIVMLFTLAVGGAWAQGTVTIKEGTADANKWTVKTGETTVVLGETEVAKDAPVTATYNGTRHVKSVTAVVKAAAEPDMAPEGVEAIDMGNGLKWANMNLGATTVTDYGDYFAWGATTPFYEEGYSQESPCTHWIDGKTGYNWVNCPFNQSNGENDWIYLTKYTFADGRTYGIWYDGNTFKGDNGDGVEHKDFASYDYADDAARANWGGKWRTPTYPEWKWLEQNCTWTWTDDYNGTGVKGRIVTSNINGNVIFLPAAGFRGDANLNDAGVEGHYCSSTLDTKNNWSNAAFNEHFSAVAYGDNESWRSYGHSVRPVKE
jgi:hypothetical protein